MSMKYIFYLVFLRSFSEVLCKSWSLSKDEPLKPDIIGIYPNTCVGNLQKCTKGYTWSFWLKFLNETSVEEVPSYIFSTGGESDISDGFYMRRNTGGDFEVGMATKNTVYYVKFGLTLDRWTQIAITGNPNERFGLFVDGLKISQPKKTSREFPQIKGQWFDPFPAIAVGRPSSDMPYSKTSKFYMFDLQHKDVLQTQQEIASALEQNNMLRIGCTDNAPNAADVAAAGSDSLNKCRQICSKLKKQVAIYKPGNCLCLNFYSDISADENIDVTCSKVSTAFTVAIASNYRAVKVDTSVDFSWKIALEGKGYVRPTEQVDIHIETKPANGVFFVVDTGDDGVKTTSDRNVSYAWQKAGSYLITVTAYWTYWDKAKTTSKQIEIVDKEEGSGPEMLRLSTTLAPAKTKTVEYGVYVFSSNEADCKIEFGDGVKKNLNKAPNEKVLKQEVTHTFAKPGFYESRLTCNNKFGTTNRTSLARVPDNVMHHVDKKVGQELNIPFSGADQAGADLQVLISGTKIQSSILKPGEIVIPATAFMPAKSHDVAIAQAGFVLTTWTVTNQNEVKCTEVSGRKTFGDPMEYYNIDWTTENGDHLFVEVNFEDRSRFYGYLRQPSTTKATKMRHLYRNVGYYPVSVVLSNAVSSVSKSGDISVESKISTAKLTATNVTTPSQPVIMKVSVNADQTSGVDRVTLEVNPGDGSRKTVNFNVKEDRLVIFSHTFKRYGVYRIEVIVKNNISSVVTKAIAQVGENITYVDMLPYKVRSEVNSDVKFAIRCPFGSMVSYTVDLGDGTVVLIPSQDSNSPPKINRNGRLPTTTTSTTIRSTRLTPEVTTVMPDDVSSLVDITTTVPATNSTIGQMTTSLIPKRKRRDASLETINNIFTFNDTKIIIHSYAMPGRIDVVHSYSKNGDFDVKITAGNAFGEKSSFMCPKMLVAPASNRDCARPDLTVAFNGSEPSVKTIDNQRAAELIIAANSFSKCDATYTLRAREKLSEDGSPVERQVPTVCVGNGNTDQMLVLPPNAFQYGEYRVEITAACSLCPLVFATDTLDISVKPSSLKAIFKTDDGSDRIDVKRTETVTLDYTESGDPDILPPLIDTSVLFDIFCFKESDLAKLKNLDFEGLKSGAEKIFERGRLNVWDKTAVFDSDVRFFGEGKILQFSAADFVGSKFEEPFVFRMVVRKDVRVSMGDVSVMVWSGVISMSDVDNLDDLLNRGDVKSCLTIVGKVAEQMNADDGGEETEADLAKKREARSKMLNGLGRCADMVNTLPQIDTTAAAVSAVTARKDQVTDSSRETAATAISSILNKKDAMDAVPLEKVTDMASNAVGAISNIVPDKDPLVEAMARAKKRQELQDKQKVKIVNDKDPPLEGGPICPDKLEERYCEVFPEEYLRECFSYMHPDDLRDELDEKMIAIESEKQRIITAEKVVTQGVLGGVGSISGTMTKKQVDGGGGDVTIKSQNMEMKLVKPSGNSSQTTGDGGGFQMDMESKDSSASLVILKHNPYSWAKGNTTVATPIVDLSVVSTNGSVSSQPATLTVENNSPGANEFSNYTYNTTVQKKEWKYHKVNVSQPNSTILFYMKPFDVDDIYEVCVLYLGLELNQEFPNDTNYDECYRTPVDNSVALNSDPPDLADYYKHRNLFTAEKVGMYRIGFKLIGAHVIMPIRDRLHSNSFQVVTLKCVYFDKEESEWRSDGVELGNRTTGTKMECISSHLTPFGGDCVVPPNTIDFNTVWAKFKDLNENAAVFGTVVAILGLYVIALIWCRYKDKKDLIKWGAIPLEDNLPTDTYYYQISVSTGVRKQSGTSSKISFILSGDDGDTGVRKLSDGNRKHFARGSIFNFILSSEQSLGPLTFLRIWHDNTGKGKHRSWYLNQIEFSDLQTGERYFFLCDRWLAVEEDDGMVERIIPVAGMNDLASFGHLFSSSVRRKLTNEHLWISVLSRPTKSSFTRVQRVSCCMSLLFLTMISNCMFFKGGERVEQVSSLTLGPFKFTMHQLYISVITTLIVFPPNLILVTLYRKCKQKENKILQRNQKQSSKSTKYHWKAINKDSNLWTDENKAKSEKFKDSVRNLLGLQTSNPAKYAEHGQKKLVKKKKQPFMFPHWCIYVAWTLCFFSVMASAFFTILYSMEWGREKSNEWLTTFLLSFFQSVIVVQPIKVLLLAAFISMILRKPELGDDDGCEELSNIPQPDEELITQNNVDIERIQFQRKMAAYDLRPPDMEALKEARELRVKEIKMEEILKEMMSYGIFVLTLFFLSYQTRSSDGFLMGDTTKKLFFDKFLIKDFKSLWKYIDHTLMPNLYAPPYYNGRRLNWREGLCINDGNYQSIRVGVGRLRQLRIKENTCTVPKMLKKLINHCRDDYGWLDDDAKPYLPGWVKPPNPDNATELDKSHTSPWVYQNSLRLKNAPYIGKYAVYKGGGYVVNFARTRKKTEKILAKLKDQSWINTETRAVMIEFTLYNPNVNLFASVVLLAEFLATGGATDKTEHKIFRLYSYVGGFGVIVIIFEVMFLLFVLYFLYREVKRLKQERLTYFKSFWNKVEFGTIVGSIVGIAMYAMKKVLAHLAIQALHESGSADYVNFQAIALYDSIYGYVEAFLVFFCTIKFIKILKFNRRMGMLGSTVNIAAKELKVFSVAFFIYFFAFCQFAYFVFGRNLSDYYSFITTIESLFSFALGSFDFNALKSASPFYGPIFFVVFVNLVSIGLMTFFLTIIGDAFAVVKENTDLQSNDYEMVEFIKKRLKQMFGIDPNKKPVQTDDDGLGEVTSSEEEEDAVEDDKKKKKKNKEKKEKGSRSIISGKEDLDVEKGFSRHREPNLSDSQILAIIKPTDSRIKPLKI